MTKALALSAALFLAAVSPGFAQAGRAAGATSAQAASRPVERYWLSAGLTRLTYGPKPGRNHSQN